MSEADKKAKTAEEITKSNVQREQLLQQIAGVQSSLEKKGVGAAFYRVAKSDPIGDMDFMGSLLFHAITGAPIADLMNEYHLASGFSELDGTLTLGSMEGIEALSENKQQRDGSKIKSSFYPLGRNKNQAKAEKSRTVATAAGGKSRFAPGAQAELAFMFQLQDTLGNIGGLDVSQVEDKRHHLIIREPAKAAAWDGIERRRRARPDGMFNA